MGNILRLSRIITILLFFNGVMHIKRPIIYIFVLQILGIIFSDTQFKFFVVGFVLLFFTFLVVKYGEHRVIFILSLVIFLIAIFPVRPEAMPPEVIGKECVVKGYISSDISTKGDVSSCVLNTTEINGINVNSKIRLSFNKDNKCFEENMTNYISFKCTIDKPNGMRNPGGFDYADYLYKRGIHGTSFIGKSVTINCGERIYANILLVWGRNIRKIAAKRISESMQNENAEVVAAMTLGYDDNLDESYEEKFREAGVSHILVVSGGNVLVVSSIIFFLLKLLKVKRKTRVVFCLMGIFVFVMVCGFAVAAVRGAIMTAIMLISFLVLREKDSINSLVVSGIVILILIPYSIYDVSFLLSFISVLSIIAINPIVMNKFSLKVPKALATALSVSISVQIGTIPIVIYYFNTLNPISIISNVVIAPLFTIIPPIGIGLAVFGSALSFSSFFVNSIVDMLLGIIDIMGNISSLLIPDPNIFCIIIYYIGIVIIFFKIKKFKVINLFLVFLISYALLLLPYYFNNSNSTIYFLDVGQGDSIFIQTDSGKNILIDGGGKESDDSAGKKTADNVLIPFFMSKGVTKLDYVFITHDHADHYGGVEGLGGRIKMNKIFLPHQYSLERRENLTGEIVELETYDKVMLSEHFSFEVYNPDSKDETLTSNNTSLVLKLGYKNLSVLFTGDLEEEGENKLSGIDADILKVGHHGSKTSSSENFLEKIKAKTAVISVGKNSFGHPSGEVLDRLEKSGMDIYRTDQMGCVIISLYENEYMIERFLK